MFMSKRVKTCLPNMCVSLSLCRGCYLGIYAVFGVFQALSVMMAGISIAFAGFFASKGLHKSVLSNILRSPMSFFDTTPLGRILNRFSKDINIVDEILPRAFGAFLNCLYSIVTTILAIIIATPTFLIVVVPVGVLYALVQVRSCTSSEKFCKIVVSPS